MKRVLINPLVEKRKTKNEKRKTKNEKRKTENGKRKSLKRPYYRSQQRIMLIHKGLTLIGICLFCDIAYDRTAFFEKSV